MVEASDLQGLSDSLWFWQVYDPAVKSDLFSSAAKIGDCLYLVDPIPLAAPARAELRSHGAVAGVLVTNLNHPRAAATFARQWEAPIFAAAPVSGGFGAAQTVAVAGGEIAPGVSAIAIDGAVPGELAFHFEGDGGTLIIGDALINFEPYGFTFLPAKYCSSQKQMRGSLRQLLAWPFKRLLFAHGTPILLSARARLEALLSADR